MNWQIEFHEEAIENMRRLDASVQKEVFKGIEKVSKNPLPDSEGGYGKPLGNNSATKLAGCCKIKFRDSGIRVVYKVDRKNDVMLIIVVSIRVDDYVYKKAYKRVHK
jgi:mRNA interferase RelE/StbE